MNEKSQSSERFFQSCEALSEMVLPNGAVAAQEFARLLDVAKYYRDCLAAIEQKEERRLIYKDRV